MTLQDKLTALKIPGVVIKTNENGFYTCYHVVFNADVTINKIKSRINDLIMFFGSQVELDTQTSAGVVIIKVLKDRRSIIPLYDYTEDITHNNLDTDYDIPLAIGQKEDGTRLYYDLTKCPHLLVAGSTGSGKSVFMHNLILSILYSGKTNLILIDVKRVEFSMYEGIPHLMCPVVYDAGTALKALKSLCIEMENRYKKFKEVKARNISEYRQKGHKMNYICVCIDELADLMLTNKHIESYLIRLAQLGRAAGVHLVVATQRPDSSILSGLIRANIPSRVCFSVQKSTDSRIILDQNGGELLKGCGDGLFLPIGSKTPTRFQSPYISTNGIEKIIDIARHVND